ncbi:MAG: O-antigen ligase family protein [Deltaproteobacteria bacterium]|nr:O-antigen ligase family protein [Deltaproteobacteria bacterium]
MARTRLSLTIYALLLILPMILLGGVHWWSLGIIGILSTALYAFIFTGSPIKLDLAGSLFLMMIGFSIFQIIPLPAFLVKFFSPYAYEIRESAVRVAGGRLSFFMPLSIDVHQTVTEVARLIAYLSVYLTTQKIIRRDSAKFVLKVIATAGAIAAAILIAHKILLLKQVYGIYTPVDLGVRGERISAPLLNENHMAAYLYICSMAVMGLALKQRDKTIKMILYSGFVFLGASVLLTLSRGGIAAFLIGIIVMVSMLYIRRSLKNKKHQSSGISPEQLTWMPFVIACALGLGLFASQDAIIGEFMSGEHKKIEIVKESFPLIKHFWLFGVGRGCFISGFPIFSNWGATVTFTHAENIIVQLLADYGLVAGSVFIFGFIFAVLKVMKKAVLSTYKIVSIAALAAVSVHNLVDFNLEIPAVAIIATGLLAVVTTNKISIKYRNSQPFIKISRGLIGVLLTLSVIMTSLAFFNYDKSLDFQKRETKRALNSNDSDYFTKGKLKNAIISHPADYYLPMIGGVYFFNTGGSNPLPYLAMATRLNPFSGVPHLYIGNIMLLTGHIKQGMLELRLAATFDNHLLSPAASFIVNTGKGFEVIKEIAENESDKELFYEAFCREFQKRGLAKELHKCDNALLQLSNPAPGALARIANKLSIAGEYEKAGEYARRLTGLKEYNLQGILLQAAIYKKAGKIEKGIEILEKQLKVNGDDFGIANDLIWLYQNSGRHEKAIKEAQRLKSLSFTVEQQARVVELEGDIEFSEGNFNMAISRYRQSSALLPNKIQVLKKMYRTAKQLNDTAQIQNALEHLERVEPGNSEWKNLLEQNK